MKEFRSFLTTIAAIGALFFVFNASASAQNGVIGYQIWEDQWIGDWWNQHNKLMIVPVDGQGNTLGPAVELPHSEPRDGFYHSTCYFYDISTYGPITVLWRAHFRKPGIIDHCDPNNTYSEIYLTEITVGGGAVQVGNRTTVDLSGLSSVPSRCYAIPHIASFSPFRAAFLGETENPDGSIRRAVWLADIVRDQNTQAILGFENFLEFKDLAEVGTPSDSVTSEWTGEGLDFHPSGGSLVVPVRGNLWLLPLNGGAPELLTPTYSEIETNPAFSPDGTRVAYTRGTSRGASGGVSISSMHIWSVDLATKLAMQLTPKKSIILEGRDYAMWSPGSDYVAFRAAYLEKRKTCYAVFRVPANGQATVVMLNIFPFLYVWPRWGW